MARKPRIHVSGALYHVMLRGNDRQEIFFSDVDRSRFMLFMQEASERYNCRFLAFCLMNNHIHLAVQVGTVPLSRIMQNISFRYTRWINWSRKRVGHLFQGRFKAIMVDADSYLLELVRYIHQNPLRACMVEELDTYLWSSHRAYSGLEKIPWMEIDVVLSQFSNDMATARNAFRQFVTGEHDVELLTSFKSGLKSDSRLFGDDDFVERACADESGSNRKLLSTNDIISRLCRICKADEKELSHPSRGRKLAEVRGIAAYIVMEHGIETLSTLSKRFNRDISAMSYAARQIRQRMKQDTRLCEIVDQVLEEEK